MPRVIRWLVAVLLLLPAAAGAQGLTRDMRPATDIGAGDRAAIQRVIGDQLAAFQRDDAATAFGFAAPNIKGMFGTPERFLQMVRDGYPPVYRPRDVGFGELVWLDGQLTQMVRMVGPDGLPTLALYFMERQPDGSWQIAGCILTAGQGVTT